MTKHIPFSRAQFRRRRRDYLRRNWILLAFALGILMIVGTLMFFLIDGYLLGALHATLVLSLSAR